MMKVLVIGSPQRVNELKEKGFQNAEVVVFDGSGIDDLANEASLADIVFDLNMDDHLGRINAYKNLDIPVVVSSVRQQLAEMTYLADGKVNCTLIGMNCLPDFINRPVVELALNNEEDVAQVDELMKVLGWEYQLVEDRVGMVTPRILFMIINEACYTLQEGTATIPDIDLGMKLGTSFPKGPFEWANLIGVSEVYHTLKAIYEDTKDERYKICPLLKTKHLKGERF